MRPLERDERLAEVHRRVVDRLVVVPLSQGDDDVRQWLGWELASLVEGHFHRILDVPSLTATERSGWEQRVLDPASRNVGSTPTTTFGGTRLVDPRADPFRSAYWLLDRDERAGTLGIDALLFGGSSVGISSLFVRPDLRRRGVAARALGEAYDAAVSAGATGLRIATNWCWQPAVRFYARLGWWVRNWKHSLVLVKDEGLWPYRVEIEGVRARFLVHVGGTWIPMLEAENYGLRLGWTERPAAPRLGESSLHAHHLAPGTFALHLALAGWPLVRSDELWAQRRRWCDLGMPEGLGYKISVFETVDRERGYDVRTPRLPGLDYRVE